ncbi:unnamed protein product [Brachionus calyciflorus]|uniref:Peptidylglycine monooxygenase n=1 Tax=Brachionus calyciflorus TaxID=104777 RepID=A0A814DUQ4_9BILA|nr:unnamed protein product [Brachionus calyciflorus]
MINLKLSLWKKNGNLNSSNYLSKFSYFIVLLFYVVVQFQFINAEKIEILMNNVTTQKEDAYICTSYKLSEYQQYITNVQPLATAAIAHHIFAFGCEKPASESKSWNCESLVCQGQKSILFAWGRNAPALELPEDVAFKVGPKTSMKYIVVNIHYLIKVNNDRSGLAITFSEKQRKYQAGIMLMVANYIGIPPKTQKYSTKFSCKYTGKNLKMFAYRVHAHMHGDVNAAYRVRQHEWTQLAKGDPQWPQAFYPTEEVYDIKDGDALIGICTYHNNENRVVYAGSTHNDEMCNVYLMYYTDNTEDVMDTCSGSTYPQLESIIPAEAEVKPKPPSSFHLTDEDSKNDIMSHHDMEGSKTHHEITKNKNKETKNTLSDFLSNIDFYDDVEQMRSRNRYNNIDAESNDNSYLDPNALLDAAFSDDTESDYQIDPALLFELAKFNNLNSNNRKNFKTNNNKLKGQLNNLLSPKTITISRYTNLENWYNPKSINLGQIGGIAISEKTESVYIFHRASQLWQMDSFNEEYRFNTRKYKVIPTDTIVVMNKNSGKFIKSWGSNLFFMPHGLTLDSEGNIWVTDVGRHQVLKFSADNTKNPILTVGELMIPGNDKNHLCQPSDVAILKNGDFFVADGYCNSRIIKFNKNGEYLTEWSSEDEMMPSHFFVPHSIALNEEQNLLCVADRENFRIQCFDLHGNLIHQIKSPEFGPIYSVAFAANNASVLYAINGYNSRDDKQYDKKVFLISTKTGSIFATINLHPDIRTPHELELTNDASEIFIGNLNPPQVFKYALVNFNYTKNKDLPKKGNNKSDPDKENFRTSIFIMGFLGVPLVLVILVALIVRLKNMGKLKKVNLENRNIGQWLNRNTKKRNGFTRLNQNSDDEEAESLNKMGHTSRQGAGDTDSDSEVEINIPQLSKA